MLKGEYGYSSLIFNDEENTANNAANAIYEGFLYHLHYTVPIVLTISYGVSRAMQARAHQPVAQNQPAAPQGFFRRTMQKAAALGYGAVKFVVTPGVVSDFIYRSTKPWFWDPIKPVVTGFMRPLLEGIIPYVYSSFDKGDINFSARDSFVFGGYPNSLLTIVNKPLQMIVSSLKSTVSPRSIPEQLAPKAYATGEYIRHYLSGMLAVISDVISGASQVGHKIAAGPEAVKAALNETLDYYNNLPTDEDSFLNGIKNSAQLWTDWAQESGKAFAQSAPQYFDGFMHSSAGFVAQRIDETTGVRIPEMGIYYAGYVAGGLFAFKLSVNAASLASRYTRIQLERYLDIQRVAVAVNNYMPAMPQWLPQFCGGRNPAQLPPALPAQQQDNQQAIVAHPPQL